MDQEGDIEHRPKGHDNGSDTPRPIDGSGRVQGVSAEAILGLIALLTLALALGLLIGLVASSHNDDQKSSASTLLDDDIIAGSAMPSLSPSVSVQPTSSPSTTPTLSEAPSSTPSSFPSDGPSVSGMPSSEPSIQPSTSHVPSLSYEPTTSPSTSSAPTPTFIDPRCFTVATYNSIDRDVARLANSIEDLAERSHFLGGIVRLVAHDFMDYDSTSSIAYGPDGCFETSHPVSIFDYACLQALLH